MSRTTEAIFDKCLILAKTSIDLGIDTSSNLKYCRDEWKKEANYSQKEVDEIKFNTIKNFNVLKNIQLEQLQNELSTKRMCEEGDEIYPKDFLYWSDIVDIFNKLKREE